MKKLHVKTAIRTLKGLFICLWKETEKILTIFEIINVRFIFYRYLCKEISFSQLIPDANSQKDSSQTKENCFKFVYSKLKKKCL